MFNIALTRHEFLVIVCTGSPVLNDYLATVGLIADVVRREGTRGVLIDLTSIPYGMPDSDRLEVVRNAARRLRNVRLAVVAATPERLKNPELVARSIGLQVRLFEDLSTARSWLVGDSASLSRDDTGVAPRRPRD